MPRTATNPIEYLTYVEPTPAMLKQAKRMSENPTLAGHVAGLAQDFRVYGFHPYDSRRSREGWPDWSFIGTRMMYRELKTQAEKPKPHQAEVIALMLAAGVDVDVWRPLDLLTHRIHIELARISPIAGFRKAAASVVVPIPGQMAINA